MKNVIMFIASNLLINLFSYCQDISKDKNMSIANIKAAGYEVKSFPDENKFAYIRYDKFGKSVVGYEYTGNIVRRVIFLCEDPTMPPKMLLEILKGTTRANMSRARAEFGQAQENEIYDYSSIYYKGKAKYSYESNYERKDYFFIVSILD